MASTAPTTQPCHLDKLPAELLYEILLHTVADDAPPQRRRTLLRLGRCSKRIARLAQRLLWHHVSLSGNRLGSLHRLQDPLRQLVVDIAGLDWTPGTVKTVDIEYFDRGQPLHLNLLAMALPGVESLQLRNVGRFDLTHTAFFHELRILVLDQIIPFLSPRQATIVFPKLVSLDIRALDLSSDPHATTVFTRATFPALRHLSLRTFPRVAGAMRPFPPLSSDFIEQLDDLQLDLCDQRHLDEQHFPPTGAVNYGRPILFHCPDLFAGKRPSTASVLPVQYLIVADLDWVSALKVKVGRLSFLPALRMILVPVFPRYLARGTQFAKRVQRRVAKLAERGIVLKTYDVVEPLSRVVEREFVKYLRDSAAAAAVR